MRTDGQTYEAILIGVPQGCESPKVKISLKY
jgi:hypothetical protein